MKHPRLFPIRRQSSPGDAPGTVIAPRESAAPVIDIVAYGPAGYTEKFGAATDDLALLRQEHAITWVNVAGLGDADLILRIGAAFGLHRLALEDVMNLHQRPKAEEFDDHIFVVTRMSTPDARGATEQVSLFVGADFVLSFQEITGDCFDPVRRRIRQDKGRVRQAGSDYLCYALLDAVIDGYFPVLEAYGERIEALEAGVLLKPEPGNVQALHDIKRELLTLRRSIWPHRDMLNTLIRDENPLIHSETLVYLRDVYDHTVQLMDIVETYREIASGLVDVYISSISVRLNETMKVLTVIATIFMPLGFVASLYGMNFDRSVSAWNMPELGWRFGYPLSLLLMAGITAALLLYFRAKGWLGSGGEGRRGGQGAARED